LAFFGFGSELVRRGLSPVKYLTNVIMGVPSEVLHSNAPTLWGSLFLLGGFGGVVLGMFLTGLAVAWIYRLVCRKPSALSVILYTLFLVNVFWGFVFEGTIQAMVKSALALWAVVAAARVLLLISHAALPRTAEPGAEGRGDA
jgi:oligosaccharide repeat unit polymerase